MPDYDDEPEEEITTMEEEEIESPRVEETVIKSQFGNIEVASNMKTQVIQAMLSKLADVLILISKNKQEYKELPSIHTILANPEQNDRATAIDFYNRWVMLQGVLTVIESDARALQKDTSTLHREIKRELEEARP